VKNCRGILLQLKSVKNKCKKIPAICRDFFLQSSYRGRAVSGFAERKTCVMVKQVDVLGINWIPAYAGMTMLVSDYFFIVVDCAVCHTGLMKLESTGIIISLRPFGERDAVARIFTENHGVLTGLLRGAGTNSKNKPLVGQMGTVSWNARLDSQLGVFHFEAQKNLGLPAMMDSGKLAFMNSMFALIETLLPEREAYPDLYESTVNTLCDINSESYLQWELVLLRDLGYALDLSHCSGCGRTDNLIYLSPRTGRAVCSDCGEPYMDKLFSLPINLSVTLRFLEHICRGLDVSVPQFRIFLKNK